MIDGLVIYFSITLLPCTAKKLRFPSQDSRSGPNVHTTTDKRTISYILSRQDCVRFLPSFIFSFSPFFPLFFFFSLPFYPPFFVRGSPFLRRPRISRVSNYIGIISELYRTISNYTVESRSEASESSIRDSNKFRDFSS